MPLLSAEITNWNFKINATNAPSTRIQILLNPYAFRPLASGKSDLPIWKHLNRSPKRRLLNPIFFRIRVDGRIRILSSPMTFRIESSLYNGLVRVAAKQHIGQPKRSCCYWWADFKPRDMCSVKRSYVDCAFKLCHTTLRHSEGSLGVRRTNCKT